MTAEIVPCEVCGAMVTFETYAAHLRTLHGRGLPVANEASSSISVGTLQGEIRAQILLKSGVEFREYYSHLSCEGYRDEGSVVLIDPKTGCGFRCHYIYIYIYRLMLSSAVLGCVLANGASRQPPLGCGSQLRGHS